MVRTALERIDELDPTVHAWVNVHRDRAIIAARALDSSQRRGLLHGIPIGVKDVIDVAGLATECGSATRRGRVAGADAWIVERLKVAGGVVVGKTVTTEFAYFAPGPTRNPHNLEHTPGGSSSGSAAAVASGMVPLALGTQTAGSLTRPAAYCGVAGYVTVPGALSRAGIVGMSPTLDAIGFLTAGVEDLAAIRAAMAGAMELPELSVPDKPRLLYWEGTQLHDIDEAMLAGLDHAIKRLRDAGASLEPLKWTTHATDLTRSHRTVMAYECRRERSDEAEHPERLSQQFARLLADGMEVTDREYEEAIRHVQTQRGELLRTLDDFDAILAPAAPGAAPRGISATGDPIMSRPWQVLGLPVVTVPGLRDEAGMPLGLQIIGTPDAEHRLLSLAHWVEKKIR